MEQQPVFVILFLSHVLQVLPCVVTYNSIFSHKHTPLHPSPQPPPLTPLPPYMSRLVWSSMFDINVCSTDIKNYSTSFFSGTFEILMFVYEMLWMYSLCCWSANFNSIPCMALHSERIEHDKYKHCYTNRNWRVLKCFILSRFRNNLFIHEPVA